MNRNTDERDDILQMIVIILLFCIAIIAHQNINEYELNTRAPSDNYIKEIEITPSVSISTPVSINIIEEEIEKEDPLEQKKEDFEEDFFDDTEKQQNEKDLRLMSSIIYAEAGNQCEAGQQAVGIVIMNRFNDENQPNTIEGVIYAPRQFTPAHNGNLDKALLKYDNGTLPEECINAAKHALDGNVIVNYNGEEYIIDYFYFNGTLKNAKIRIGDHDFA